MANTVKKKIKNEDSYQPFDTLSSRYNRINLFM